MWKTLIRLKSKTIFKWPSGTGQDRDPVSTRVKGGQWICIYKIYTYILYTIYSIFVVVVFYLFISSSPNRYVSTLTSGKGRLCRPNIDDKTATPLLLILQPSWRDTAYQWYAKWSILDNIVYLKPACVLSKSYYSSRQFSVNRCQLLYTNHVTLALLKYLLKTILLEAVWEL